MEKIIKIGITETLLNRIDYDVEFSNEYLDRNDWILEAIRHYDKHRFQVQKDRLIAYGP